MHKHSQTLDKEGRKWRQGRGWLYHDFDTRRVTWRLEWHFLGTHFTHAYIALADVEDDVTIAIAFAPLFSLWFSVGGLIADQYLPSRSYVLPVGVMVPDLARKRGTEAACRKCYVVVTPDVPACPACGGRHWISTQPKPGSVREERQIGLQWRNGGLDINLWHNPNEGSSSDPWWWNIRLPLRDWLLGQTEYNSETLEEGECQIVMPEGTYPLTYVHSLATWKRPRWPKTKVVHRFTLTVLDEGGIPIPGKGESAYNCEDDAVFDVTIPAERLADAILAMFKDIAATRERYGGPLWRPERAPL